MAPAKGGKQATTRRANDEILEEMKNKNKKLLKRLECLTSSIIDRVLNVFKMKQVNHIKKSTKDENIKGEKIFTNEALKQEKDVNVRNWNSFRFQGCKTPTRVQRLIAKFLRICFGTLFLAFLALCDYKICCAIFCHVKHPRREKSGQRCWRPRHPCFRCNKHRLRFQLNEKFIMILLEAKSSIGNDRKKANCGSLNNRIGTWNVIIGSRRMSHGAVF